MTIDLALSDNHDLALDLVGRASLIDGAAKVAQQIKVTLLAFLGEWFLDTSFGVPYFEEVLVKTPTRVEVQSPLPAGCRIDAGRLQHINEAGRLANSAGQPGPAVPAGARGDQR
ncbi:hypothetical protein ACOTCN_12180 [Achromobacter xylosoxidans]